MDVFHVVLVALGVFLILLLREAHSHCFAVEQANKRLVEENRKLKIACKWDGVFEQLDKELKKTGGGG